MYTIDANGFYHPESEEDVADLIILAGKEKRKLRVYGSRHSAPGTYELDAGPGGQTGMVLVLDEMTSVEFDDAKMEVTVGAGCCLGTEERPLGSGNMKAGLVQQLQAHKWALPVTGGILHQTVGGFLSTGSAGSSSLHSFSDQLVAVRLVDGMGGPCSFSREDSGEEFYACGLSLGLLGVLVSATFKCVPEFIIEGEETTHSADKTGFNLFSRIRTHNDPPLKDFFDSAEYGRCIWWPQRGVEKFRFWKARRITSVAGQPFPRHYKPIPPLLGFIPVAITTSLFGTAMRFFSCINPPPSRSRLTELLRPVLEWIFCLIARFCVSGRQQFCDTWVDGLPMDNAVDYRKLPTVFSETWVPFDRFTEVVKALQDHYASNPISRIGTYCVELYTTPPSKFWLSPAYEERVMKFDFYWFGKNKGDPEVDFFPQFWDILMRFDCRFHWGKFMPGPKYMASFEGYLRARFKRWDDFMQLRERMDPLQIFVTHYWRERLGIKAPVQP